jgi:type IV secretory pathway TraG/TraD family ATPase VirD4
MRDDEQIMILKSDRPLRCGWTIYFGRPETVRCVAEKRFAAKPKVPA